jgi:hypothetical protein
VATAAVDASRTDGGVVTPLIVNTTDALEVMSAPAVVTNNVRVEELQVLLALTPELSTVDAEIDTVG